MSEQKRNIVFTAAEYFIGAIGLMAILLATLGVITRFVLKISITWSDELLRTVFIWAYFIGTALLYRGSGLMRLELVEDILRRRRKTNWHRLICVLQDLIVFIFSGSIFYYLCHFIEKQIVSGQTTTTSSTPAWVSPLGFIIGIGLLCLFAFEKICRRFFSKE
ncbi:MAG: TRAP transporter small permease [Pyramidobacter sp.]|uniref:TRAP transporter small permease n=1 Tax=Pyramidobacter sp. TaxID=1943581 RepID=UPI002A80013D|nr:TRAP transporter small permease [Pyramidobacter sp.]MDY4032517.1 TRAP transporter small permease [Pyramidobacter sp.]